jgi:phosphoketolase
MGTQSIGQNPLGHEETSKIATYWRACCYLAAGMIYLRANPCSGSRWRKRTSRAACSATVVRAQA